MPYHLPLEPRPRDSLPLPLSAAQWLYWHLILRQQTRGSPYRNIVASLRITGPLDMRRLEHSLQTLRTRHESLRTRISHFNREQLPTQVVDPPLPESLHAIDLSRSSPQNAERIAQDLGREFLSERVDLREGPLFATRIFKLSEQEHVLILALDHIVSDATSYPILTRELLSSFRSAASGGDRPSSLRIQFPDYALWQHKTTKMWRERHEAYWHAKLLNYQKAYIPTDYANSPHGPTPSAALHVPFGIRLTDQLREVSRREHSLVPYSLLTLYLVLMARWCERSDLLVNFISHGRHSHSDLRDMIGCLAHPVFLRIQLSSTDRLRDILQRVTSELQTSLASDSSRVQVISDELTDVTYNWLPAEWGVNGTYPSVACPSDNRENDVKIRHFPVGKWIFQKFAPVFTDTPSGIFAVIWYDSGLFLKATMDRFGTQLRRLGEIYVHNPNATLASLDLPT